MLGEADALEGRELEVEVIGAEKLAEEELEDTALEAEDEPGDPVCAIFVEEWEEMKSEDGFQASTSGKMAKESRAKMG